MADPLTRIMQLIALAGSNQIEEARTAAHKACEMIRNGKFKVVHDGSAPAPNPAPRPAPPRSEPPPYKTRQEHVSTPGGWSSDFEDVFNRYRQADWYGVPKGGERPQQPPPPREPARQAAPPRRPNPETDRRPGESVQEFFARILFGDDSPFVPPDIRDSAWSQPPGTSPGTSNPHHTSAGYEYPRPSGTEPPSPPIKPRKPYVLNPEIPDGNWVLKECKFVVTTCNKCESRIKIKEEAWHSRYEIRCKECSVGPAGEAFSKEAPK